MEPSYFLPRYLKMLRYILISFALILVIGFVRSLLEMSFGMGYPKLLTSSLYGPSSFAGIFNAIVVAPIIEEFTWRYGLVYDKKYISISLGLILSTTIISIILRNSDLDLMNKILVMILTFAVITTLAYLISRKLIERNESTTQSIKAFWSTHQKEIVVANGVLFGLSHLMNFESVDAQQSWLIPFIVFPQCILGYCAAKIRVEYGIIWSIQFHGLSNLLVLALFNFTR